MTKNILFVLLLTLLVWQSHSSLLAFGKSILPIPSFGGGHSFGGYGGKGPVPVVCQTNFKGPTVHSKHGCDIQVLKTAKGGLFGGFTDSFKNQLSQMLSEITTVNSPQAVILKARIMNSLLAINRILNLINQYPHKENDYKPLLQIQVKKFLEDLDDIQDLMTKQTNVTVVGNNNAVLGQTGTIKGNNSVNIGNQNTLIGNQNTVVGSKTIVSGNNNNVKGNNNVAVGKNNNLNASNAIAFTNGDSINQSNTLTVGNNTIDLQKLNGKSKNGYLIRD